MAVIKYKDAQGNYVALTNYTVQPIVPVQTTGSSTTEIMSQDAVTKALATKANSSDVYTKAQVEGTFLTINTASSTYLAKTEANNTYLSKTDASSTYLTQENATNNYLTKTEANNTYQTQEEVTQIVNNIVYGDGSTTSSVVTEEKLNTTLENYQEKLTAGDGISIDASNNISCTLDTSLYEVVSSLPTNGKTNKIYLVSNSADSSTQNVYNEWAYANEKWEKLGEYKADIDLTPYLKSTDASSTYLAKTEASSTYLTKTTAASTYAEKATTLAGYGITDAKIANGVITLGSNTITPLTETKLATDYVAVEYPTTEQTGGVVFTASEQGDDLETIVANIDTNVSTLVSEVLKNEEVTALGMTKIKEGVGLSENGEYVANSEANYISAAKSFSEADTVLDGAIKNISDNLANYATTEALTNGLSGKSDTNHTHDVVTSSVNGFMSSSDKSKLDGIAANANNYSHPADKTAYASGLYKITVNNEGHVTAASAVAKSDITALGIPAQDTTYSVATTSANGLMSSTDKSKLDGIAENANNYSLPTASASVLGGVKVGTNLSISNGVLSATDTTYSAVTSSANGLMIASDKAWLDFMNGCNKVTSIASVPVSKRMCVVTISAAGTFSVASTPAEGREVHIIVKNSASSDITVTLPKTGSYVNISGDSLTVPASSYAEINVMSDGTNMYLRAL